MDMATLQIVAMTLGALVSIVILIKWVWPWIKRCSLVMFGNAAIHERLDDLHDSVKCLVTEVMVNDGSSLRDAVVRIEESVALANERQRVRMLDDANLIFETDVKGNFIWVNRTFCRVVQRQPSELIGRGWLNVLPPARREAAAKNWYRAVGNNMEFETTVSYTNPDDEVFEIEIKSYRMSDGKGETIGYWGTITLT